MSTPHHDLIITWHDKGIPDTETARVLNLPLATITSITNGADPADDQPATPPSASMPAVPSGRGGGERRVPVRRPLFLAPPDA